MSTQAVINAREQLRQAEADIAEERKAEAKTQLEEVRGAGRKLRRELNAVVKEIEQGRLEVQRCDHEIALYKAAIAAHEPLDPVDFPSEKQIAAHQAKLDELIAGLDGVAKRRLAAVNSGPGVYVALELDQRIIQLQYTVRNLENVIRGEKLGFPEGGIAAVR
jgi:chromosome segregation ATPase